MSPAWAWGGADHHLPRGCLENLGEAPATIAPGNLQLAIGSNAGAPAAEGIGRGSRIVHIVAFGTITCAIIA